MWFSLVTLRFSLLGKKGSSPSSALLWSKAELGGCWKRSLLVFINCVLVENKENLGRTRVPVLGAWLPTPS